MYFICQESKESTRSEVVSGHFRVTCFSFLFYCPAARRHLRHTLLKPFLEFWKDVLSQLRVSQRVINTLISSDILVVNPDQCVLHILQDQGELR